MLVIPVTLRPGLARLATSPVATGSKVANHRHLPRDVSCRPLSPFFVLRPTFGEAFVLANELPSNKTDRTMTSALLLATGGPLVRKISD